MGNIVIVTDSACDLNLDYIKENNIILLPFTINIDGVNYKDIVELKKDKFYEKLDEEAITKASGVGYHEFQSTFRRELEAENDIIYIGVSSSLSNTYSFAEKAREEFDEKKRIALVDSKSAAFGQGLLIKEAIKLIEKGESLRDVRDHLNILRDKLDYSVMINDINMLRKSGKVLGIKAFSEEALNVKPIITIDGGRVNILKKVKGTKAAMRFLLKRLNAFDVDERYPIIICYGSDMELREMMENRLREFNFSCEIESMKVGATVGSHTGKSGVGILFVRR